MSQLFSIFDKYPQVFIALSEKSDGNMKPTGDGISDQEIYSNQDRYIEKLKLTQDKFVILNQNHGDKVAKTTENDGGKIISDTDAVFTNSKKLYLTIRVADCLPIFMFDPNSETIAIIHAGWSGLANGIISKTVEKIKTELGFNSATIVGIGPAICSMHYEVKKDVSNKFENYSKQIISKNNKIYIDLAGIARLQLIESGIDDKNIETNSTCTFESEKYFSYRRDKSKFTECQMAVIGLSN